MAEGSTFVPTAALIGNAALAAAKFVVAGMTGSAALFAEAVHSTVATANRALLLLGLQRAAQPEDPRHPFGQSREIYFWTFVLSVLVFGIGSGLSIHTGIRGLRDPQPLQDPGWSYEVLGIALAFALGSWLIGWRAFDAARGQLTILEAMRRPGDPSLVTVLFQDGAALAGLVVAFLGIFCAHRLGWLWADGLAALVIGLLLGVAGLGFAIETRRLLIGEAASPRLVEDIIGIAGQARFVNGVNEVRTLQVGTADVLVNLSLDAYDDLPAREVERGVAELESEIKARFPEVSRVFVEIRAGEAPPSEPGDGRGV